MQFFERVAELEHERIPFALAIVVSRRAPVSSHIGDRAVVFADGRMEGFVGGSCSRDIVRRYGVEAIRSGVPRLLHIRPEPASPEQSNESGAEHVFIPMSCASEGAADVYLEPHLPGRRLIIAGFTPVADALARGARALGFDVVRMVDDDERGDVTDDAAVLSIDGLRAFLLALTPVERARSKAVVATLGHYDEAALDLFLDAEVGYVGLVASRKRAERVFGVLAQQGCSRERLATVRNPVGIDIGARAPADVAVSILADIVASAPGLEQLAESTEAIAEDATAVDPICGMDVELADAKYRLAFEGRTYFFCCGGCRAAFAANPKAALASMGSA